MSIYKDLAKRYSITEAKAKEICEMPFEDCIRLMNESIESKFIYNSFFKVFVKPKRKEHIERIELNKIINKVDE